MNNTPTTTPVWFRIGAKVELTTDEIHQLHDGEGVNLVDILLKRGLVLEGDTYAYDEDLGLYDDNTALDLDTTPVKVTLVNPSK